MSDLQPTKAQKQYFSVLKTKYPEQYKEVVGEDVISHYSRQKAAEVIGNIQAAIAAYEKGGGKPKKDQQKENPFREGSKRHFIAEGLLRNKLNESDTYKEFKPEVGKRKELTFNENRDGQRQPLPVYEQRERLRKTIHETKNALLEQKKKTPQEQEEKKEEPQRKEGKFKGLMNPEEFLEFVQKKWRPDARRRNAEGASLGEVSMRVTINAARGYKVGIPFEATIWSSVMHYPKDVRSALGIDDFDHTKVKIPSGQIPNLRDLRVDAGYHKLVPYIEMQIAAGIYTNLVGPAGGGKSTIPAQLAEKMGLQFGVVPMTAGASPSWVTGAFTLDGWKTRPFLEIYKNGGVFLFDEMDAADPNMLITVNGALANGVFFNPADGETYEKHDDFIPFAAMNTYGLGANRAYTGRERLDAATLDRWITGRVFVDYDETHEKRIFETILAEEGAEKSEEEKAKDILAKAKAKKNA